MNCYQLSPHIFIERFDENAVMLVADRDMMVTVNDAAVQIFEQAREVFGSKDFDRPACVDFLLENYQMSRWEAERQTRSMLVFGLRQGIVLKRYVADSL